MAILFSKTNIKREKFQKPNISLKPITLDNGEITYQKKEKIKKQEVTYQAARDHAIGKSNKILRSNLKIR